MAIERENGILGLLWPRIDRFGMRMGVSVSYRKVGYGRMGAGINSALCFLQR